MDVQNLRELLEQVQSGDVDINAAMERLRKLPYDDMGFAKLDGHRNLRNGFPEVVFCQGKATSHVIEIFKRLSVDNHCVFGTRANQELFDAVKQEIPDAQYNAMARIIIVGKPQKSAEELAQQEKFVLVISAGTADIPVAEEAAVTAELLGSRVVRCFDVGVAGIHRLLDQRDVLFKANAIVTVAGMEGALASVVGGLVNRPVVAVPTSVGYGANFGGLAALLSMLNSCAVGVSVVNIDNGFGAGYLAHMINQ